MTIKNNILELLKNCIFDGILTENDFWYKIVDQLPNHLSFRVYSGASKLVLIPDGADYVIKIPFTGRETESYDADEDDYYEDYIDFSEALYGKGWDYCLTEAVLYHKAKQNKVEKVLCKTQFIGKINEHPIYIQERAILYWDRERYNEDQEKRAPYSDKALGLCMKENYAQFNNKWITDAYMYYGEKLFNKIMAFITSNICDLHGENIGYIGNRPVILDYSSWYD